MFRTGLLFASALWLGLAAPARACQVPVFRYALERWWPDPYVLVVAHKGDLTPELAAHLKPFRDAPDSVNLEIEEINVDEADAKILGRFHGLAGVAETPTLLLYYPDAPRDEPPVYSAPFTKAALDRIIDSPARRQIASRILKGDSAVWIVLDSGIEGAAKEEERLRTGLKELAGYMELPEGVITPDEADDLMAKARAGEAPPPGFDFENVLNYGVPLRLGFSVVRIDTKSEEESAFVRMLLASDPDLDPAAGPVAIPVFGRGRMLQGLPVKTLLDEDILPDACYYICGACSCQVKGQNPGLDLLMKVDWEGALEGHTVVIEKELPPLTGAGDIVEAGKGSAPAEVPLEDVPAGTPPASHPNTTANGTDAPPDSAPTPVDPTPPSPAPNPEVNITANSPVTASTPLYVWLAISVGIAILGIAIGSYLVVRRNQK